MGYELHLRSTRYPADIKGITEETVPGGPLAEDIAAELRRRGYRQVKVINHAPLWLVEVDVPPDRLEIVVTLFQPSKIRADALWNADLPSKRGFWARWRKRPEDPGVLTLAKALEASVRAIDGLRVVGREGDWDR